MAEKIKKKDHHTIFSLMEVGRTIGLPLLCLTPTQPDNGKSGLSDGLISAYCQAGKIFITQGHPLYYGLKRKYKDDREVPVRKVKNPLTK
jgi:hypothetical protein